ncbi:MAG: M20/M25/M40 family metallo-hydrolase [Gemmatimonadetes bacterium]|nr:M20/M25/M40 family metallo-hydrolase [Gemmatimonadota bacterium]
MERVVNVNSGTMNHEGVREVGGIFQTELDALGFETRWIAMPDAVNRAGHLFAERGGGSTGGSGVASRGTRGKRLLLIGHLDTVFERESPFQRFLREDSIARGPGVADMKGGDVVMLYALQALHSVGALEGTQIIVALIGDEEEPGQPLEISRRDLIEAGRRSDVALGFEGAIEIGTATIARRGSSGWTLAVRGITGHSSRIFSEEYGAGAIFEAARILNAFYEELRGVEYLVFNAGVILGGTEVEYDAANARGRAFGKTNVIPQTVIVDGGLRFISEEQKEGARARMRAIVQHNRPKTSAEIHFRDSYPAMSPRPGNQDLLRLLDRISRELGYGPVEPVDPARRGAADISFVASFVDGLDGLGVVGDGAHSPEEWVDLRSLPILTKRAALLIHRLTRSDPRPVRRRGEGP